VIYEDRTRIVRKNPRYEQVYRDRRHRLCNRIIWPRYHFPVCYRRGTHVAFRYVYPYYRRRYLFVSLGGFWPSDYLYLRYYWYPAHYFYWYGYEPIPRELPGDTYNYYTYNYYGAETSTSAGEDTTLAPVDHTTFEDVREKLAARQAAGPEAETPADTLFDDGVKRFGDGDYAGAADKFASAMALAPDDIILPFAYAQALFADGRYTEAAGVLRTALEKLTPEQQGVFYPRGLYLDEDILTTQIHRLTGRAEQYPSNSDLQLLLGYQWLGIGELDKALPLLTKARDDYKNFAAASALLKLAEKIKQQSGEAPDNPKQGE